MLYHLLTTNSIQKMRKMLENYKSYIPNIHKDGYLVILLSVIGDLVLFSLSNTLGWLGLIATILCVFFFRDPDRVTPQDDDLVVSPADGVVVQIAPGASLPKELGLEGGVTKISIFLNILDVHVNRIPVTGVVLALHYTPGKFFNASLDKSSEHNERQAILIETKCGKKIGVVQIAGVIARRIVCDLQLNQAVVGGQKFGIIRFGSRVDLYLPSNLTPQVLVGQKMTGGETIIAKFSNTITPKCL
ncbi:Phosphatidylserine decarboxylase proenzyme [Alphaproteobacteria bacterium]